MRQPANKMHVSAFPGNCGIVVVHEFENVTIGDDAAGNGKDCLDSFIRRLGTFVEGQSYPALVVFSDVVGGSGGEELSQFIVDNDLGEVQKTQSGYNQTTGNDVLVYVWQPVEDICNDYIEKLDNPPKGEVENAEKVTKRLRRRTR